MYDIDYLKAILENNNKGKNCIEFKAEVADYGSLTIYPIIANFSFKKVICYKSHFLPHICYF